jgi:hypothetical protein
MTQALAIIFRMGILRPYKFGLESGAGDAPSIRGQYSATIYLAAIPLGTGQDQVGSQWLEPREI